MELNLENLSVEDLKTLHKNINLLLKDKCKPKYKEQEYFINPENLSFIRMCYSDYYVDGNLFYRIEINDFDGVTTFRNVEESFIDKCISISEKIYISLLDYKDKFITVASENLFYCEISSILDDFHFFVKRILLFYIHRNRQFSQKFHIQLKSPLH